MNKILNVIFITFISIFIFLICSCNKENIVKENIVNVSSNNIYYSSMSMDISESSSKDDEINLEYRETNLTPLETGLLDFSLWKLQYPSGSDETGMLQASLNENFSSKYLSREGDYLRFSLDAEDKGKSPNGSSVRAELRNQTYFDLSDEMKFEYKFKVNSTNLSDCKFTVGQFLLHGSPDKPLLMIEIINKNIKAYIKYYTYNGTEATSRFQSDSKFELGQINNNEETSIKFSLKNRNIKVYRDNVLKVDTNYLPEQQTVYGCYAKIGIYYQTKRDEVTKYTFTDVYVKDIKYSTNKKEE